MFKSFYDTWVHTEEGLTALKATDQLNSFLKQNPQLRVVTWKATVLLQAPPWPGGDIPVEYLSVEFCKVEGTACGVQCSSN